MLSLILPALDELPRSIAWTFGGGTALALKLGHCVSYDVDIFFEHAEALRILSPQRNRTVRALADRWQEPGNYIKLERDEGAIDLIVAARRTDQPTWRFDFRGRQLDIETPAEVLAKKLHFRGSTLLPRDVFDCVAAHAIDPAVLKIAVAASPEGARRAVDRIKRIADRAKTGFPEDVNPTTLGARFMTADPQELAVAIEGALAGSRGT